MKIPLNDDEIKFLYERVWKKMGFVPQSYQLELLLNEALRIICLKSRGIGYSLVGAFKFLLNALFVKHRHEHIIVAQDKQASEHILQYIIDFYNIIKDSPLEIPKIKNCGADMVAFSNGGVIYSKPSRSNSIRSLHGDVLWTETGFTMNSDDMYKAINGSLRPNFSLIMESSPNEMDGVLYNIWTKGGKNWTKIELPYSVCSIPGFIEGVEMEKKEAMETGRIDDWQQEYNCKFIDGATRLFPWELIASRVESHKVDCATEYVGMDFGKKMDESVAYGVGKDALKCIRVTECIEYSLGTDYSAVLPSIVSYLKDIKTLNRFRADETGVGIPLLEFLRESEIGYLTEGVVFTNAIKEKLAMYFYMLLNAGKIYLPNDKKLLKQIHGIKREKTEDGHTRYKHEDGKHDDHFWSLCLALMGYMNDTNDQENQNVETNGSFKLYGESGKTKGGGFYAKFNR